MNKVILYSVLDNDPKFETEIQGDFKDLLGFQDYRIVTGKEEKGRYTIFAFLKEWEVVPLTKIFKKYEMFINCKDITNDVVMGRFPSDEYKSNFEFVTDRKILNDFIKSNTTIDHVLDMISESGIDNLNEFQRTILKNF